MTTTCDDYKPKVAIWEKLRIGYADPDVERFSWMLSGVSVNGKNPGFEPALAIPPLPPQPMGALTCTSTGTRNHGRVRECPNGDRRDERYLQ